MFRILDQIRNHFGQSRSVGRRLRRSDWQLESLEKRQLLAADFEIVKDINQQFTPEGSNPNSFVKAGSLVFFTATTADAGTELWKTDGTQAGTVMVKDIGSGSDSGYPYSGPSQLTNVNGTLYFSADDGTNGEELWKSNGTAAGTVMVKDIGSGSDSGYLYSGPSQLTNIGGTLYFTAKNANGYELWKSNGTDAGTVMVKDIRSGNGGSYPEGLTNVSGTLYFSANDGTNGHELWKSNGTDAGTVMVEDINTLPLIFLHGNSHPSSLTNVSGTLYFSANDGTNGRELWKSDGTDAGTVMVKDNSSTTRDYDPEYLQNVNGTLYFEAREVELWISDGTAAGTVKLKNTGVDSQSLLPRQMTNVNGTLYFEAFDSMHGGELWKTDGTRAGTVLVKDVHEGLNSSLLEELVNVGGVLYFRAGDSTGPLSLWKSDGTETGTVKVVETAVGHTPSNLTNINGTLYFSQLDEVNGYEFWKSNGTAAGTVMVKNIERGDPAGSSPEKFTDVNGTLYFTADNGLNGVELWKVGSASSAAVMVKDIYSGSGNSYPSDLTNVSGTLYFTAYDGNNPQQLWKTDGTAAGTVMVKTVQILDSTLKEMTNVNGTLYFTVGTDRSGNTRRELWKSDGTAIGTVIVKNAWGGFLRSYSSHLTNVNGTLYFTASDPAHGEELWKTDGTSAGTVRVKDINSHFVSGSGPEELINVGGTLYFAADDGTHGQELWKSDGTSDGTVIVKNISGGFQGSFPRGLTNSNGTLYFTSFFGLWKSDGTANGTVMVREDVFVARYSLTDVNGTLYFEARGNVLNGFELWKSNGTATGTVMVKDIHRGSDHSYLSYFTNVNGTLYFSADDGRNGKELWKSDGTNVGTVIVRDFEVGASDSEPGPILAVRNRLFVAATTQETGRELFVLNLTNGTTGNDAFVLNYSGTSPDAEVTVTLSTNGGPVTTLGTFATSFPLPLDGLGGTDTVRIVGTAGNDVFKANAAGLSVNGAGLVLSSIESRTLAGRAGDDTYQFDTDSSLGTFTLDEAGGGTDTLNFSTTTTRAIAVNLSIATSQTVNAGLKLILSADNTVENVIGGSLNDTLIGNSRANSLTGNGGNDILVGLDGNDNLQGGAGLDVMIGGLGLDVLNGGADDDILIAGRTTSDTNTTSLNTIRIAWTSAGTYAARVTKLRAGVGSPVVSLKAKVNVLNDAGENDSLNGGAGSDWYFKAIDDVISGLASGEIIDLL